MIKIGSYNTLNIYRAVDFGVYMTDGEDEILLPKKFIPAGVGVGDDLEVYVYLDSEQRPIATTQTPKAVVGDTALMRVKEVNRFGAFLDWGLDKDLMVPFKEQREPMIAGQEYVVRVILDSVSNRIIASDRLNVFARPGHGDLQERQEVDLLVCYAVEAGYAVLINETYQGLVHKSDAFKPLRAGDRLKGYISKLRPDGKNDVVLRKPGFAGVVAEKPLIMEKLREAGGFLPYNSDSSPEAIKQYFKMSKKVFKQAIGNLYKERLIVITEAGIKLV